MSEPVIKTIFLVIGIIIILLLLEWWKSIFNIRHETYEDLDQQFQQDYQQLQQDVQQLRVRYHSNLEIPDYHPHHGQRSNDEILEQTNPQNSHTEINNNSVSIQIEPFEPPEIGWISELEESNDLPSYGQAMNPLYRSHNNLSASIQPSSQITSSRSTSHLHMPSAPPASNMSQDNDGLPSYGEAIAFFKSN